MVNKTSESNSSLCQRALLPTQDPVKEQAAGVVRVWNNASQILRALDQNPNVFANEEESSRFSYAITIAEEEPVKLVAFNCINKLEIRDQQNLFEIAKTCAEKIPSTFFWYIDQFGIEDQSRITEIAEVCAIGCANHVPSYTQQFAIEDRQDLFNFARVLAKYGSGQLARKIICFEIKDQKLLVEMAKICAEYSPQGLAEKMQQLAIEDPLERIEIARICAKTCPSELAQNIRQFEIEDQQVLIRIAKTCAENSPDSVGAHIEKFAIKDPKELIEIGCICARKYSIAFAQNIKKFGIKDQKMLAEIAMNYAQEPKYMLAYLIQCFEIQDESTRIEIAMACAKNCSGQLVETIHYFGITDQSIRIRIARICAQNFPSALAEFIQNFAITDQSALIEIAEICAQLDPFRFALCEANFAILDPARRFEIAKKICTQQLISQMKDIPEVILKSKTPWFRFVNALCEFVQNEDIDQADRLVSPLFRQKQIDFTFEIGAILLSYARNDMEYQKSLLGEAKTGAWKLFPYVALRAWKGDENGISECFTGLRDVLKNGQTNFLFTWLQTILILEHSSDIPSAVKFRLFQTCCKDKEGLWKLQYALESLDHEMIAQAKNFSDLSQEISKYNVSSLRKYCNNDEILTDKSIEIVSQSPHFFPLITYLNKIKENDDNQAIHSELLRLVQSIAAGKHREMRYSPTEDNAHLFHLHKNHKEIFFSWIQSTAPSPSDDEKMEFLNTDDWTDLLVCGEEFGTCLSFGGCNSHCLLGPLNNGMNRMLVLRDKNTHRMLARAIIRILFDSRDRPVLFIEHIYSKPNPFYEKKLKNYALSEAARLRLPLFENKNENYEDKNLELEQVYAKGSSVPYDYSDGVGGVVRGAFSIPARLLTDRLIGERL